MSTDSGIKTGKEATQFKPGQSGNPGGRPKLEKSKMFLGLLLEAHGFDWVGDYTEALVKRDRVKLEHYATVMPHLAASIRVCEFAMKPDTAEESKLNADKSFQEKKLNAISTLNL